LSLSCKFFLLGLITLIPPQNPKRLRRYRDDFEDRPHPDPFGKAILYLVFALAVAKGILYLSGLLKRKTLRIWDQVWTQVWKRAQEEVDRIRAVSRQSL
jgi:hypothetical protein